VTIQTLSLTKSILEKLCDQGFIVRQSGEAVAEIPWGQYP
jgi:hypothetical protein